MSIEWFFDKAESGIDHFSDMITFASDKLHDLSVSVISVTIDIFLATSTIMVSLTILKWWFNVLMNIFGVIFDF